MKIEINVPGSLPNGISFTVDSDEMVINDYYMNTDVKNINTGCKNEKVKVGDIIPFTFTDGEEVEALAVQKESDGMLFIFVDCLKDEYPMNKNNTNKGGYNECDLRGDLNDKIFNRFPTDIKNRMIAFANGDFLRLATEKEIFGENQYGEDEPNSVKQFELMKRRRNRMAFQGKEGDFEYYWLQNKRKDSAANFAYVHYYGYAISSYASSSIGVRPCFLMKMEI